MATGTVLTLLGLGVGGFLLAGSNKKKKKRPAPAPLPVPDPIRPPRPDLVLTKPETPADFKLLDRTICEFCGGLVGNDLAQCVAEKIYPAVVWPPVQGDHPSIGEVWAAIQSRVSAFAADPTGFCKAATESPDPPLDPPIRDPYPQTVIPVPVTDADFKKLDRIVCDTCSGAPSGDLVQCVAKALFPSFPWPPIEGDHSSIQQTWDLIGKSVGQYLQDPEAFCVAAKMEPASPVSFVQAPANASGYPQERAMLHRGSDGVHYPTPGMFFQVGHPDAPDDMRSLSAVARGALGSALVMAGADTKLVKDTKLRMELWRLITCSPWNDALYGQTDPQRAGGSLAMGPHGRGLNWRPVHVDNLRRLESGLPALRGSTLGGYENPKTERRHMLLWLPAINLEALRGPVPRVTTEGMVWSDGTTTLQPPPAIQALGVDSSGLSEDWGCGPGLRAYESVRVDD